jgi:hypothetical protein
MDKRLLDLYADYLLSSFSYTTATGLSALVDNAISHDKITRFLSSTPGGSSAHLWSLVKPLVRRVESEEGVVIVDDSIAQKPYTDENDLICWHFDHKSGTHVKGINFLTALYCMPELTIPVGFELVTKTKVVEDEKTGKTKRKSERTKNEYYRGLVDVCVRNQIQFRYVLNDVWYASSENMKLVKIELKKDFIMPVKGNRDVARSLRDKRVGSYVRVEELNLEGETVKEIYLEGVDFPVVIVKEVFINEDGSNGVLYLVSSDTTLSYDQIRTIYQKRWRVEQYHKSLKHNASSTKSPTRSVTTQRNHFFASVYAFAKLEILKMKTSLNHFALRGKIYISALKTAFEELQRLQCIH